MAPTHFLSDLIAVIGQRLATKEAAMKHPETHCDCIMPATSLALRWRCSACGKSTIFKLPIIDAVCDGESLRSVEVQGHENA
jgi:hypothetical protein